jgi:transcriptional regulator with XRE-family HTH domain
MARAALNWGVRDLAAKADVATNTVSRFENGADMMSATLAKVQKVLEEAGIDFPDEFTVSFRRMRDRAE